MSQYSRWPVLGGGGGGSGTVTDVNVTSSNNSINISGSPITTSGTIDLTITGGSGSFAGFNGSGDLESIPGWSNDGTGQASGFLVSVGADTATSLQLAGNISTSLTGGYEGVIVSPDLSSGMSFMSCYNAEVIFEGTYSNSGGIGIYQDQSNFNAGASTGNYESFASIAQLNGTIGGFSAFSASTTATSAGFNNFTSFNASHQLNSGFTNSGGTIGMNDGTNFASGSSSAYYSAFQISPVVHSGANVSNVTGLNFSPTLSGTISNSFQGVNIAPSGGAVIPNVTGLNINLSSITTSSPQGAIGIQSDSRVSINAETQLVSAQGFQIGNRVESLFHIPSGSPVTGTDALGNDMAGDLLAEDNLALGPTGLGWISVGFIADMAVAVTKTVDTVNVFVPAVALPDPGFTTGGHVNNLSFIRMFTPLSQGGSITIDNVYSVKLDPVFGNLTSVATNAWGIWIGDTTADNWFAKNVIVGGTTGKPVGSAVLSVVGHYGSSQATAPTVAAQTGAGTGASAALTRATDTAGVVTITAGTLGLNTGPQAIVTFNKAYSVAPLVVLTAVNAATGLAAVGVYVTSSTTTMTINFAAAGVASTVYSYNYHIIETQ